MGIKDLELAQYEKIKASKVGIENYDLYDLVSLCHAIDELDENKFIVDPIELEVHSKKLIEAYKKDIENIKKNNLLIVV